jgi:hypothetical protein
LNSELDLKLREAVARFWTSRETQAQKQVAKSGVRDAGARAAVTGGSQMDGFIELVRDLLEESGVNKPLIYCERCVELPGWFRPEKKCLIAAIEFKSQVGSFGNNYNNRTEEALGSAVDLWAAYREGAFKPSARPWLGYVMLLEEARLPRGPSRHKSLILKCLKNSRPHHTPDDTKFSSPNSFGNGFTTQHVSSCPIALMEYRGNTGSPCQN